eukprot:gene36787-47964_t
MTEEYNDENEECANGKFSFVETDDNGAELLTFCVTTQFKIMDSYFERQDGEFGTWASNRSNDKGFKAALDHNILVSGALWGEVVACGVYIPTVRRWNTDHRMVELNLGQCSVGRSEDAGTERKQVRKCEDTSGPTKLQQACTMAQRNFNKRPNETANQRDSYWTEVAEQLEKAYEDKDMKRYHKLIKEAHGPQLASTTKGRQSLSGQHMKGKGGTGRSTTTAELETRW